MPITHHTVSRINFLLSCYRCFPPHFFLLKDYLKASPRYHIISLINKDVFPFWHSHFLALKIVLDVALKRMILERVCNVFLF